MTAQTNNQNILAAANQIIVALNDISTQLSGTNTNITNIDTRLATTNAQLSSLTNAIAACCSNLNIQLGGIRTSIQNIRLQTPAIIGEGGYYSGDTGGQYLDDTAATVDHPPVNEYVCKAANYIYSWMDYTLSTFAKYYGIKLEGEQHLIAFITADVTGALSAVATGPGAAAVWAVVLIAVEIALEGKNAAVLGYLDVLRSKFAENKQQIICDLYEAGTTNDPPAAKAVWNTWTANLMEDVLAQEVVGFPWPLSEAHKVTISYLVTQVIGYLGGWYLCNLLFEVDPDVEAYDDPGAVACDCGCLLFQWPAGAEGWTSSSTTNGNTVSNQWVTDYLQCEITKTTNTDAFSYWTYTPTGWIVTTGDSITAQFLLTYTKATGAILRVVFTDETTQEHYQPTTVNGTRYDFEVIILAENTGKEIDYIQLEFHSGYAATTGTGLGAWEFCQVCLANGTN